MRIGIVTAIFVASALSACSDGRTRPDADLSDADQTDADEDNVVPLAPTCDIVNEDTGCSEGTICTTYSPNGIDWLTGCVHPPTEALIRSGKRCHYSRDELGRRVHDCAEGHHCMNVRAEAEEGLRCLKLCSFENAFACQWAYENEDGVAETGICAQSNLLPEGLEELYLCYKPDNCDPRCGDCDSEYDTCIFLSGINRIGWTCHAFIPRIDGDGRHGDSCVASYECRAPNVCRHNRCRQACQLSHPSDGDADADEDAPLPEDCVTSCDTGTSCEAEDYYWVYSNPDIGLCGVAQ